MLSYANDYVPAGQMSESIRLELVSDSGLRDLGPVVGPEVILGRDPSPSGVKIDNTAISRNHGVIFQDGRRWFYKDLGSTNGSWLDGRSLADGLARVIRPGSTLQLADSVIQVVSVNPAYDDYQSSSALGGRSLIVYKNGTIQDEFPIAEYGRALVVGGTQADVSIEGDVFELPSIVFERRGDKICAVRIVKDLPADCNGNPLTDIAELIDGDYVSISEYQILYNDPSASKGRASASAATSPRQPWINDRQPVSRGPDFSMSEPQRTKSGRVTFGQFGTMESPKPEETFTISPEEMERRLQGSDMHPSARFNMPDTSARLGSLEDRVLIAAGAFVFAVLFGFAVWFFMG